MEEYCIGYNICILETNLEQWMLSPPLSPNTSVLSHVSWYVRWGLAFACERSKLGALTAAYLWNSSKTTLILFRLALLEISLCLCLSFSCSPPVWLSLSLTRSPLLLCCQVYLSSQLPWTILFLCHSVVRVMCMWVWGLLCGDLLSGENI